MANRTNKQNRTFSRTCSVCSSSAPHRTEPNNTLVRFVFGRISNIDTHVRFVLGKFELLKAKPSTLYSLASELWIAGVIPELGSQNNGRGTMVGRTMASLGSTNTAKSELSRIPRFSLKSEKPKTSHFLVILTHGRTIV